MYAVCWESPGQLTPQVQMQQSLAEVLQNDMQITASLRNYIMRL
jgi:hypothetical protein